MEETRVSYEDDMPTISFVFPVHNEADNVPILYEEIRAVCEQSRVEYELVFVNDGSTDRSLEIIKTLREQDPCVHFVSLSRNFGHQAALFAGMAHATGDAVITMDADLQHPPSLVPQMIALWRNGVEVVYTTKRDANYSIMRTLWVRAFYWIMSKLSGLKLHFGQCDFRLIDRRVAKVILQLQDYHKFLRGQVEWVGFTQQGIAYDVERRRGGTPTLHYRSRFAFAFDGIFGFSAYPLHLVTVVGAIISVMSLLYIGAVCGIWLLNLLQLPYAIPLPSGWATLTVSIVFLGSLQLIAIGIVGTYVGRIYDQSKNRPVFIVRESSKASNEMMMQYE
jgi:polyisoprenyl-phosphate glycosyltransferase